MGFRDTLKGLFGTAWHVNHDNILNGMSVATDGTAEASKPLVLDSNKDATGVRNLAVSGTLKSSGGGVGYATGAGGTVTQGTSKSTAVTLDKLTGQITTHNANLTAGSEVAFTVNNSQVAATDIIVANIASGGTSASYALAVTAVAAGSFELTLTNLSAGTLGEALVINYAVIKGVAA